MHRWLASLIVFASLIGFVEAQNRVPVEPTPAPILDAEEPQFVEAFFQTVQVETREEKFRRMGEGDLRSEVPVPGLTVALGVDVWKASPRNIDSRVLATVVSDGEGFVRAKLEIPTGLPAEAKLVAWVRIQTPGYSQVMRSKLLSSSTLNKVTQLKARLGNTLFGQFLDSEGSPIHGARVALYEGSNDSPATNLLSGTDANGRFAVDYPVAGTMVVRARSETQGIGESEPLQLKLLQQHAPTVITLLETLTIEGRVVDDQGVPLASVRIQARPARNSASSTSELESRSELLANPLQNHDWTDAKGQFEIEFLSPGDYTLYADWSQQDDERHRTRVLQSSPVEFATVALAWNSGPADFRISTFRLEVRLDGPSDVDFEGERVDIKQPGHPLSLSKLGERSRDSKSEWTSPIVMSDRTVFLVEPNSEYALAWNSKSIPYAERIVRISPTQNLNEVTLSLTSAYQTSELKVHALDPSGGEFTDCFFELRSRLTGEEVQNSRNDYASNSGGFAWRVTSSPGHYILSAYSYPLATGLLQYPSPRAPFHEAHLELELKPGMPSTATINFAPSGHLNFESLAKGTVPTAEEFNRITDFELRGRVVTRDREMLPHAGRVVLISQAGERLEASYLDLAASLTSWPWVVPGWDACLPQPLPPGLWTIRVEGSDGHFLYEGEAAIRGGETTVVRW